MPFNNNQIKDLTKDFDHSNAFKYLTDRSIKSAETFVDRENGNLWFAKTVASNHQYAAVQLIGNKIYKHYLGELASDDVLVINTVLDRPHVWIASKQIKDFKTLNHVGDACTEKEMAGIEKLHVIKILLNHWDQELNNLGLVVSDKKCFATGVDADGALDEAFSINKPTFDNIKFNKEYNLLKKTYYMAHELKILSDSSSLERGFGILYDQNYPEKFTLLSKSSPKANPIEHDLSSISIELKEKILTQLHNKAESVILNNLDATEMHIKDEPHYVKEYDSSMNKKEMLSSIKEVINTDHSVFREIVNSSLEEVRLYFNVVKREPVQYSYKEMENVYFNYLVKNQEALKIVQDSIQQELFLSGQNITHDDL